MPMSLEQFSAQVVASQVLSADDLQACLATLPASRQPQDAEALARELVRQKKLTAYQAQQIYAGKGKSLVLGNYVILDKLGQGGMGMVLKAEHKRMERLVALKVLSPAVVKTPEALRRFQREVKAAARLTHPNIVIAHDADEAGSTHFLVMEFVDGADLSSLVKKSGPLPVEKALACLIQAARGLQYAHEQGIVHRDIKPANLLLDGKGTVKILDMGLARLDTAGARQDDLTGTGQIMGTVDYMAPEQAMSTKNADHRADIYSLGVTLWYLLTGKALYDGDTVVEKLMAHQSKAIPSLVGQASRLPGDSDQSFARLNTVFQKMVAKTPAERFQSMTDVIAALEACRTGGGTTPTVSLGPSDDSQLNSFLKGQASSPLSPRGRGAGGEGAAPRSVTAAKPATSPAFEETLNTGPPSVDTDPTTNLHVGVSLAAATKATTRRSRDNRKLILYGSVSTCTLIVLALGVLLFWKPSGRSDGSRRILESGVKPSTAASAINQSTTTRPSAAMEGYALDFDGTSAHVLIPSLTHQTYDDTTLEAWIRPRTATKTPKMIVVVCGAGHRHLHSGGSNLAIEANVEGGLRPAIGAKSVLIPNETCHIAGIVERGELRLYVNGQRLTPEIMVTYPEPFARTVSCIAGAPVSAGGGQIMFDGLIQEVRISRGAVYSGRFKPERTLTANNNTLALYRFDEGTGDVLRDSSGNNHHGQIVGAKWVMPDGTPIPASSNSTSGATSGTDTPLAGDLPSTAELAQLAISGDWQNDGGAIVSPVLPYAQLALPGNFPPAYKLTLEVTREAGTGPLVLGLPVAGKRCLATIDNTPAASLSATPPLEVTIGDLKVPAPVRYFPGLALGKPARIECRVSSSGIAITIDGQAVLVHESDLSSLSQATTPARWQTTDRNLPFIGASLTRFRITKLEVGSP